MKPTSAGGATGNYYNEIDPFASQWMRNLIESGLIGKGEVDERSIADVSPDELAGYQQCHFFAGIGTWSYALRQAGWPEGLEVWTGSCPCQPFSAAGKRQAHDDERHLWPEWFRLIRQCRPGVVLGEQVASKDGLAWLDAVQSDLEAEGYAFGALDICAAGFGAPHIRQRLYFVGYAEGGEQWRIRERGKRDGLKELSDRGCRAISLLADADGRDSGSKGIQRSLEQRQQQKDGISSQLADVQRTGLEGHAGNAGDGNQPGRHGTDEAGSVAARGPVNGFWSDAEWIWCRDEKYRAVEPGTFPLAHGSPKRVGRLRGYGNGIVAPAAVEFIKAVMEEIL